jgi:hypothetical protein
VGALVLSLKLDIWQVFAGAGDQALLVDPVT